MPAIAARAQQVLNRLGIQVLVEARSYGEIDSCGTFDLYGFDFDVTLKSSSPTTKAAQQNLAQSIYQALAPFGKPNLGNVKITFAPGNTTVVSNNSTVPSSRLPRSTLGANWQQIPTAGAPSGRYIEGMAYDSDRHVTVLFGGDDTGASRLNDTWEYNGTNWSPLSPAQSPPGRANIDQTLVYDSTRKRVVLFGGLGLSGYLADTWEYNGTNWSQISASPSPASRDSHAMAFDSNRGATVLFGGYGSSGIKLNDTWEYNGSWHQVAAATSPAGRFQHAIAYDSRRHVIVLFGGLDSSNSRLADTWEYDGTTWQSRAPTQSPPARNNHSMTYDSARGVIVMFGGSSSSGPLSDTWEYDGTTWTQAAPSQSPSARTEMSLVFDSQQNKIVFFGGGYWGGSGLTVYRETWEYTPSTLPLPIYGKKVYVLVYDPILSNGQNLSTYLHWNLWSDLTQGTINFFAQTTNNRVQYSVAYTTVVTSGWPAKIDGFTYTEPTYLSVINHTSPAHSPDAVDYNAIANSPQFDICGKLNRGEIDEVWIYNGPYFGFYESTLVGPGSYWYNSPPVPGSTNCNRMAPLMGPSPERGVPEAVHNFGHRTESTMVKVYGTWQQNSIANNWEKFALVKALSPNFSYSGCGNIHYPPNGTSGYDYGNTSTVMSNCADFVNYPNLSNPALVVQPVTCSTWGCSHLGFLGYWFGHLPSNAGCGPDSVANDWYAYFANPALALNPRSACPSDGYKLFLPMIMR